MTRAGVVLLNLLILNGLLAGLCIVVSRSERPSRALRLWGYGLLMYSAGILMTLAGFLPLFVSKVVGNALIAYAPILAIAGALEHTRFRLRPSWTWIGFAVSVTPIVVNHLRAEPSVLVDFLAPAPLANALFLLGAFMLLRDTPPLARTATRFLAGVFIFSVLVWTARMASIWLSIGATNDRDRADLVVALFAIAQIVTAVAATLGLLWLEVRLMSSMLEHIAYVDALTELPNRRATLRDCEAALDAARRDGRQLALAVFDVDRFKSINDGHGHLAGDAALAHVASLLRDARGPGDRIGRIGGEEFVLLAAGAGDGRAAAERVRANVAASPLAWSVRRLPLTLSAGVATYPDEGQDWDTLFAVADRRLYAAKQNGRNRVVATDTTTCDAVTREQEP